MKKIFFLVILLTTISMNAQAPSDNTVIKKVRERYRAGKIQLNGATTRKEKIKNVWHYYYWRHFTVTATNSEGLTGKMTGAVIYEKFGNKYVFHNYARGEESVSGIKKPSRKKLQDYLQYNLEEFLGGAFNDIVSEVPKVIIPENTKFNWASPQQVTFNAVITYTRKISNTEVEKATHTYETMLFRKSTGNQWNRILADEIEGMKKVIGKKPYNPSMKALSNLYHRKNSKEMVFDAIKVTDIPVFKSDKQLFYFIHNKLKIGSAQKAKAYLYGVLSKNNFDSSNRLKGFTQIWLDKIVSNLEAYKSTYCDFPKVKEEQEGAISFYDKETSKSVRFRAVKEGNTWKLLEIAYYVPSQDLINRVANSTGNCAEKPDLSIKEKINYQIGAIVDVKFSNGTFPAEVNKKDTNFDNRYYVKLLNGGRGYWVTDDTMSLSTAHKETPKQTATITENPKTMTNFQVGDHVGIRTRSGVMKGTITKATGSNFLIKLDKSGYQDMWVKKEHLIKQ